ncbi:MAG: lipoyl(octanoyl) transferase [Ignavibacteriae bacterium]|nr:MAG: lipoyl(octanoyl) transferase [Ignavibacteriota bacterium]
MKQSTFKKELFYLDLGSIDYQKAWDLQHSLFKMRIEDKIKDLLILCEHPHTYTLGRLAKKENLLFSKNELDKKNINVFDIDRGGDITYHGPGQIVGYPIINLVDWKKDTHLYLRTLEEVIIKTCNKFGLNAGRNSKHTGVWINDKKICAIGIKISKWVTMHGFAFNVNTDMEFFNGIIPCGIQDKSVTNFEAELNSKVELTEIKTYILNIFLNEFSYSEFTKINLKEIEQKIKG